MGLSAQTVANQMTQALAELRTSLSTHFHTPGGPLRGDPWGW
jgi:hypothetical protein